MSAIIDIYSKSHMEIKKFLDLFLDKKINIKNANKCEIVYYNPLYCADIISTYIDNIEKFEINLWLCLDKDFFINITKHNADKIIRYLFERYPY